jgi:hypothetical protein
MSIQPINANTANQQVGASSPGSVYTLAGLTGLSSLVPLGMLSKKGKDIFQKNERKVSSTILETLKKNPWVALAAVSLAGTGATVASKKSVNSQVPLGERAKNMGAGLGTSAVATVPEVGAGLAGAALGATGIKAFKANGRKIIPTLGAALKENPICAALFTGCGAASVWLERKSSHFQDKAIAGKSSP